MDGKEHSGIDPQKLLAEWLKTANKLWPHPPSDQGQSQGSTPRQKEAPRSIQETILSAIQTLGTLSSAMGDPQVMNAVLRGTSILPDVASNLVHSGMQALLDLQKQLSEKAEKIGASTDPYTFDTIDHDTLQAWSTMYEEEIQRYFQMPQLGLSRFYQERINKTIDKYNIFATSLAEFLQILQMPFEKTTKAMQEKIEELMKAGTLPEDSREYYRMWVKTLEGHFMTLFQSTQYNEALGNTMAALEDYLGARNSIIQDMLQSFPIPTNKEMNDLYKEIYLLKKKVRELEKAGGKE